MGVTRSPDSPRSPGRTSAYERYGEVLDKLLRATEDGEVRWTSDWKRVPDEQGGRDDYVVYEARTPAGDLVLHGMEEHFLELDRRHEPVPSAASPAQKGEARLFLVTDTGRAVPFPPVSSRAFQSVLDNLLTAVRYQIEGPVAEEFTRRFLAGGDGATGRD